MHEQRVLQGNGKRLRQCLVRSAKKWNSGLCQSLKNSKAVSHESAATDPRIRLHRELSAPHLGADAGP